VKTLKQSSHFEPAYAQNNLNKLKGTYNISDIDVLTNVAYLSKIASQTAIGCYALKKETFFLRIIKSEKLKSTRFGNANLRLNLSKKFNHSI
jgi:hypothetical protein